MFISFYFIPSWPLSIFEEGVKLRPLRVRYPWNLCVIMMCMSISCIILILNKKVALTGVENIQNYF